MQKIEAIGPSREWESAAGARSEIASDGPLTQDYAPKATFRQVFVWSDGHSIERLRTNGEALA